MTASKQEDGEVGGCILAHYGASGRMPSHAYARLRLACLTANRLRAQK